MTTLSRGTRARRPVSNWLLVYGSLIVLSETALAIASLQVGALMHVAVLLMLASHTAFSRTPKDPQLPALTLLPLIRLLSLVMPLDGVDAVYAYLLTGAPAAVAVVLIVRAMELPWAALGLAFPRSRAAFGIVALTGVPVGLILTSNVGAAMQLDAIGAPPHVVLVAIVLVAALEEVIFRGLLQHVAAIRAPRLALLIPNVLYASMYLGAGNGAVPLLMGATGVLFSALVARTGTVWGVIAAHVLMRVIIQMDVAV